MILIQKQKYDKGLKALGPSHTSASKLAEALGLGVCTPRIRPNRRTGNSFINYGCSSIPWFDSDKHQIINKPSAVKRAVNKLDTLIDIREAVGFTPEFTTTLEWASEFFDTPKAIVFCRTLLSASSGKGIVVARKKEELVEAPLYTLYVPKKEEYRVHVAFNKVIHIQKKVKLSPEELENRGISITNKLIRNLNNGYVFTSNIQAELESDGNYSDPKFFFLTEYSINAIKALNLDFGAVDLIVGKDGLVYVLEVNTAPGLEEPTLSKYVEAFNEHFNQG